MPLCKFEKTTHTYTIDGAKVPSVSEVLGLLAPWKGSDMEPAYRGTYIHDCCTAAEKGELDFDSLEPGDAGMVRGWMSFLLNYGIAGNIAKTEEPLFSPKHRFGGTPDRVCFGPLIGCVIDIKTGADRPTYPLQLQAYAMLAKETYGGKYEGLIDVFLFPDGNNKVKQYKPSMPDQNLFLCALQCHNWRSLNRLNQKEESNV